MCWIVVSLSSFYRPGRSTAHNHHTFLVSILCCRLPRSVMYLASAHSGHAILFFTPTILTGLGYQAVHARYKHPSLSHSISLCPGLCTAQQQVLILLRFLVRCRCSSNTRIWDPSSPTSLLSRPIHIHLSRSCRILHELSNDYHVCNE